MSNDRNSKAIQASLMNNGPMLPTIDRWLTAGILAVVAVIVFLPLWCKIHAKTH